MLKFKNILKKYDNFELKVSFNVKKGEIFGLIGESGSGKTTILKLIQNIIQKDEGEIEILEKTNISSVFQDFNLLNNLTILENVFLPLKLKGEKDRKKAIDALKFVGLLSKKDLYISTLSGGQKQRVVIARCIVENPDILLLDEPTAALDNNTKNDMANLFLEINKNYGTTIILVTHDLQLAKSICNKVALVDNGKILEIFDVDNKLSDTKISYCKFAKEVLK